MGADVNRIEIIAMVSNRWEADEVNPEQLLDELRERITAIVDEPRYAPLTPFVA